MIVIVSVFVFGIVSDAASSNTYVPNTHAVKNVDSAVSSLITDGFPDI